MEGKHNKKIFISLSIMMFFQYIMFAVWWVPLAAYLASLNVSRGLTALILSSIAFGSMVSPLVGNLADKHFKAQYLLAFSNAILAIMLVISGFTQNPAILFITLLIAMLFYTPSWALTSTIALKHTSYEVFPKVRVFGTIGWIFAGIFSLISLRVFETDFDGTRLPFFVGAGLAILGATLNLTLPNTPPLGKEVKTSLWDILGFRSLTLLKNKNFAIFLTIFTLAMIPFSMYWSFFSEYLLNSGYELITVTMSLGQFLEIFIILSVPLSIKKWGLRNTMLIGIAALVVRYVALFLAGNEANITFVLLGVAVHGLIFGYYHIGAQIYTDRIAPTHLKSQAQGLIFFATFAIGLLVGNFVSTFVIDLFTITTPDGIVYDWQKIWGVTALKSAVLMAAFMVFFRNGKINQA